MQTYLCRTIRTLAMRCDILAAKVIYTIPTLIFFMISGSLGSQKAWHKKLLGYSSSYQAAAATA